MKAVVIRDQGKGPSAWKLVERDSPRPAPGQVLVRVRAASLNYRDLAAARGLYGPLREDLVALSDGAGEVTELGAGVTRCKVGDRVMGAYHPSWKAGPMRDEYRFDMVGAGASDGWLAEAIAFPEAGLVRIPEHLSFEEAATLPCAAVTAWNALFESAHPSRLGSSLLVQGTGGVSIFALQFAHAAGIRVVATTSSAEKAARLKKLGADVVINYRERPDWHEAVLAATSGNGVDKTIEVGGGGTLAHSLQATRFGGSIVMIGILTGVGSTVDPLPILLKVLTVEGRMLGSVASFEEMNSSISRSQLRPVVDEVFPLARAPQALAKLEAGTHLGKIVVNIS